MVTGILSDQSLVDLTRKATYEVEPTDLASVNDQGLLKPMRDGEGSVRVTHGDVSTIIAIEAENILQPQRVSFDLSHASCSPHRRDVRVGRVTGLHMVRRDFDFRYSVQIEN